MACEKDEDFALTRYASENGVLAVSYTHLDVYKRQLKVSKPMNQQEAFYKQNPFYPYSNILHPYSISGFEDFTTSKTLSVDFRISLAEAAANTERIYRCV